MKVNDKTKPKKGILKRKDGVTKEKPEKEKIMIVAQEIKYARLLCSNEKKTRDRVLKALKKWLSARFEKKYEFKEDDFMRLWKGLFYAVWMSDKPLVQEELCENIASILDCFPPEQINGAILMMKAGFKTLATEWYGIDHHRMDKFLMLVRRYLRGSLRVLQRNDWSLESCDKFAKMLADQDGLYAIKTPHYARNATSMILHLTDCYLEEISKVSGGRVPGAALARLLRPALLQLCRGAPPLLVACRRLLTQLLRQSEPEQRHQLKIQAWKRMGCPEGGPDALVTDDEESDDEDAQGDKTDVDDDNDSENKPLDPRAGRVNVELAPLEVPAEHIQKLLREELTKASSKAYTRIKICLDRVSRVMRGAPPLPLEVGQCPPPLGWGRAGRGHVVSLLNFEHKLNEEADELRLRGLSRKHRKRLLRKARSGLSIVEDVQSLQTDKQCNGDWKVETLEETKDAFDKENQKNNKKTNKRKTEQTSPVLNKKQKIDVKQNKKVKLNHSQDVKKKEINKIIIENTNEEKATQTSANETKNGDVQTQISNIKIENGVIKTKIENKSKLLEQNIKENQVESTNKNVTLQNEEPKEHFIQNSYKFDINSIKNDKNTTLKQKTVKTNYETPKKVKFALKNNSMQKPIDYYKSVRQSPNIPYDSSKKPKKTNLKPCTPSPINPFFKKKLKK